MFCGKMSINEVDEQMLNLRPAQALGELGSRLRPSNTLGWPDYKYDNFEFNLLDRLRM